MPNRILRDWTDSYKIASISGNAEIFFVRLIMKVDDYGRFFSDKRLLKSLLFPLKPDIRESDISRWLTECEKSGLITLYSVANKEYVQIEDFKQTLRQKKERFPSPKKPATHPHSTCIADDIPESNQNQETETESEAAADFSETIPSNRLYLKIPLGDCVGYYFLNSQFQMARESLAASKYMTIDKLKKWADVFIKKLAMEGITEKSLMGKDDGFVGHFANWMKYRGQNDDPAKFGLKSGKNEQASPVPFDRDAHFKKMQEQLNRLADEKRV
jgi:hypothetical protein